MNFFIGKQLPVHMEAELPTSAAAQLHLLGYHRHKGSEISLCQWECDACNVLSSDLNAIRRVIPQSSQHTARKILSLDSNCDPALTAPFILSAKPFYLPCQAHQQAPSLPGPFCLPFHLLSVGWGEADSHRHETSPRCCLVYRKKRVWCEPNTLTNSSPSLGLHAKPRGHVG